MKMKAFIIMFNRFANVKALAENLSDIGCEVILIDNNSTYPPLLQWYNSCPYKVHRLSCNYLSMAVWDSGIIDTYTDKFYIVTDNDLDISQTPVNFIEHLMGGLISVPDAWKAGLSLEIGDLPDNEFTIKVISHESRFWDRINEQGFYIADVATTLALYDRHKVHANFLDAIRSPRPYTARHLDWYKTKETLTEEDLYYYKTTNWKGWIKYLHDATDQ